MGRYNKYKTLNNTSDYYKPLREIRNKSKALKHYETPIIHNPTVAERASLKTTSHIWKYGDRFYKLADQYYGDVRFWWVIAWYNGAPTEATLTNGNVIYIPLNLENALKVLRA